MLSGSIKVRHASVRNYAPIKLEVETGLREGLESCRMAKTRELRHLATLIEYTQQLDSQASVTATPMSAINICKV